MQVNGASVAGYRVVVSRALNTTIDYRCSIIVIYDTIENV